MTEKNLKVELKEIKHNILNLLTSLKGQLSLLELKENLSEKGVERCKKISKSCRDIEEELKKIDLLFKQL